MFYLFSNLASLNHWRHDRGFSAFIVVFGQIRFDAKFARL